MTIDWRTISASTAAAAALLLGCGGESEETSKASAGDAGEANWKVENTPSPGKQAAKPRTVAAAPRIVSTELPASFPEDVPQYPGAKVRAARSSAGNGISVTLASPDDFEKVASFYADTFAARGWSTDIRRMQDGQAIFADKGGRTANAVIRPGEGGEGALVDVIVILR